MSPLTKITLVAAFILGAGSAIVPNEPALASSNADSPDWTRTHAIPTGTSCPTLEGYPDCHPDSYTSRAEYSASPRHPLSGRSPYQRRQ
jgi:hypothetical protein